MITTVIQFILGLIFTILALTNLSGSQNAKVKFRKLNMPIWFMYVTGIIQLIGGITMLIGITRTVVGIFSGTWIAILMLGAVIVRIKSGESIKDVRLPFIIGVLSLLVLVLNIL